MSNDNFNLKSKFEPAGDQPKAIDSLMSGLKQNLRYQTLFGVTGSGKTFTMANVIAKYGKPTLVIAHNKTLAAQLAQEYREFFPDNAVHYFVSYYDYYQPEAYIPVTDTYIEKEAQINEEIDRLRHAATQSLLTRKDVIIVASVSCIYNLGSPEEYQSVNFAVKAGETLSRGDFMRKLAAVHYERSDVEQSSGTFRSVGNSVEVIPAGADVLVRLDFGESRLSSIAIYNKLTKEFIGEEQNYWFFPAKHFIANDDIVKKGVKSIKKELTLRIKDLQKQGKMLEAERLKRRTKYDLAMIREIGYCNGIENYSRHFSNKAAGDPPDSLLSYFPKDGSGKPDFLTIIDESHVTVPQIGGMQAGDASRKKTLIEHGFRLPSAADNRPLNFTEFSEKVGKVIFTSATPSSYEKSVSANIVEQVIRPTGLVDPEIVIRPVTGGKTNKKGQVNDFVNEILAAVEKKGRVIATTLTKKMAEDFASFLTEKNVKSKYLHSDIDTLERIEILSDFRRGVFDCLVGVNLLREGLDLPEVTLIGIFDADREGFLRSETSLIQIIGRAARNIEGRVILYADTLTKSINSAVAETLRRRKIQIEYNKKHNITPKTIVKKISDITEELKRRRLDTARDLLSMEIPKTDLGRIFEDKKGLLETAIKELDFETAAVLRDEIKLIAEKMAEGGVQPPKKSVKSPQSKKSGRR